MTDQDATPEPNAVAPTSAAAEPTSSNQEPASKAKSEKPGRFTRFTDIVLWLLIAGALAAAFMPRSSGPNIGQPATEHELPRVGESGSFTLPGKLERPLLIEAFASWCSACKRTSGTLDDLTAARESGRLDVIAVSVDDHIGQALSAKETWPIQVDVLHDKNGAFASSYRVDVLPTYILVGTDGRVKRVTSGVPGASDLRAWLKEADE